MLKSTLYIIIGTLFLSSCAFHYGNLSGTSATSRPVGLAYGTSETKKFLGIGGNSKDALVLEAKKNMYLNYPLEPGQVYGNFTIDFKKSINPFTQSTKVIVSADILSNDSTAAWSVSKEVGEKKIELKGYEIGEEVLFKNRKGSKIFKGKLLDIGGDNTVIIGYTNLKGIYTASKIFVWQIQAKLKDSTQVLNRKFEVGETVKFTKYILLFDSDTKPQVKEVPRVFEGTILKIIPSRNKALVEYQNERNKKHRTKMLLSSLIKLENPTVE
ncbi:DUF6567 family protein [Rapidithrix thailandica]|uniref:DUF6567 family protein n=1 Tax=Rapidithrix thailandica TaxID=413964 RepID=A0AAW9SCV1_9BACT